MRASWTIALAAVVSISAAVVACGSDGEPVNAFSDGGVDGGPTPGDENSEPAFPDAALIDAIPTLEIKPHAPTLVSSGSPVVQPFQAFVSGIASPAKWSIDNVALGAIDAMGTFTASGAVGGVSNVTAQSGAAQGSTTVTVNLQLAENPGNVSASDQTKLKGGGNADGTFKWLYPYDKTVFPRGLTPPTLQFAGVAATSYYVHITSKYLTYDGFFAGSSPARIDLSPATWKSITQSAQASDPVAIEVTKLAGGVVTGPIKETWNIAQGSLKGTVYYNSYTSQLAGGGAILKMKVGQPVQVLVGGCNVCHSVSANGNVLASMHSNYVSGATYDLTNNATPMAQASSTAFSFAALYPDGSKLLSCGTLPGGWPPNVAGLSGNADSALYDTKTGGVIPSPGLGSLKALMPAFSPDGTKLAFNHYAIDNGHTLGVMDFATATNTFSGLSDVVKGNAQFVGWPAFLPDSKSVLFQVGTSNEYRSDGQQFGDVLTVDLGTNAVAPLDSLNGIAGGSPYLPYGAEDVHTNYEPTVLPIAVGGYYWVLFTSRRRYGNTIAEANQDSTRRKKLWVAAIDLNPQPGKDPSHPAIYLPDQELAAGNMRGFWALDPCKQNGNGCEGADECCGGFCRQITDADGAVSNQCVPPPMGGCAQEFEKCTIAADCCGAGQGFVCINGHCAQPAPN